jgi:putative phage-type endonuclease
MQTHDLTQGSQDWHAYRAQHFNASDAPAMMGVSPYKSRTELLHEKSTGMAQDVDAATQARFDDGHRFEALARSLAEEIVGENLYPVTGSCGELSASFDGLTMAEDVAFEHKTLNDEIRAAQTAAELGEHLRVQMEHQLLVSGAEKCLFIASKWTDEDQLVEEKHFWYEPDMALRNRVIAGWGQFKKDLADYQHVEVLPSAVAAPTMALPALSIQVGGSISLQSNLTLFGAKLQSFIDGIDKNPSDDQAFADAEAAVNVLEKAQVALEAAESSALAQTASIDEMCRTVAMYKELARTTRLMLEKIVKARKETIRIEIMQGGKDKAAEHITVLNQRLGKNYMPTVAVDFAGVMKGKKSIASLRDAVSTELSRFKIESNTIADKIQINLNTLRELAVDHAFLFADTAQIVLKANDDLTGLVKLRIAEHTAADAERAAEKRSILNPAAAWPMPTRQPVSVLTPPTLRLGQIGERLGFALTADFIRTLGFEPAGRDKAAVLYHEGDFAHICAALVQHINQVHAQQAA